LHGLALNECTRRLSYLAVKAAILLGVVADRSGIELTGKGGERTSRGPARRKRRELLEEAKGQIDHTLLAGLPSPAAAAILGHISGENDGFKCRQNFADLHSVTINGTEGLGVPESMLGEREAAKPLNLLDQSLCGLLDIREEGVVFSGQGSFHGPVIGLRALESLAKPSRRFSIRRGDVSEFQ